MQLAENLLQLYPQTPGPAVQVGSVNAYPSGIHYAGKGGAHYGINTI